MKREKIKDLLLSSSPGDAILAMGWVKTRRDSKDFSFIELNDGSCLSNLQVIADHSLKNFDVIRTITTGSSIKVHGILSLSKGSGQKYEVQAKEIEILDPAPDTFPLQKKRHTDEFLRSIAHLRSRTNKYSAVFRIRSELSFAIHQFFNDRGFFYIHTPIITGSDCEGAGEMFRVSTLNPHEPMKPDDSGKLNFSEDFFGKEAKLTVSGQLSAEMLALGLGDVYTFGPTFRAENSNTSRHMAEFWMLEPEMAFCDLQGNMDMAQALMKSLTRHILEKCSEDMDLFFKFVDTGLKATLENLLASEFIRLPYGEAVSILQKQANKFEFPVEFGKDLQSEHERFLTESHFKKPVIVFDYPKTIKPFYMRVNDDHQTVAAMDILVPGIGEIIGGSQREERLPVLLSRMEEMGLNQKDYWWYIDSRRFGSVPHSGFGLGFERMMMFLTGIRNIRDVIPFPRTPKSLEF
ncbi:MAG: asparagine--tRNA ligase [Proteobacteria bacterium]|nr:asparagine--tRNA ligase [Pseudomonadota bacterium]MBU4471730.1 asparagine--tRNA ligase [Pseudomonadota bacterium]MCG2750511.1 asparagine--tRNA ligase [Desulfobacteraceae bacterium]